MSAASTSPSPPSLDERLGRELTDSERAIDILGIDRRLAEAKDELERAINAEKRRAIRATYRRGRMLHLNVTGPMVRCLRSLLRFGKREARAELERLGYQRSFAAAEEEDELDLNRALVLLRDHLRGIEIRLSREGAEAGLGDPVQDALIRALYTVPGARDVASQVISTAFASGLGATFEENEHLVDGWQYTAVLDSGLCANCAPFDGRTYGSWTEAQVDLPNGGPNPLCLGGGRCRCRLVPLPA